ncbi:MAG: hypothetical protein N2422_00610 [Rhodobacteraceae bacterium]|nr:hypothetical protein [Paracoccaceae bacterium]
MHDGGFEAVLGGLERAVVAGIGSDGRVLVGIAGAPPVWAETLVALGAAEVGRTAVVGRLDGAPLVLGLLAPPAQGAAAGPAAAVEAVIDGESIVLSGRRQVTLRCGKASVTLTADGRITIRGTEVRSLAEGANRVQGASVQLN